MTVSAEGAAPTPPDALGELLQAERSFATRLEAARAEGETLVARARQEAEERAAGLEHDVDVGIARLETEAAAALDRAVAAIRSASAAACARFDDVDEARIREHARHAIRAVVAGTVG